MKSIEVVAAIIKHKECYLCVQRAESKLEYVSKKYEFPGGKAESGETLQQALVREIQEELSVHIFNLEFFMTVEHQYPDFHIRMHSFLCEIDNPDELVLNEHVNKQWLTLSNLHRLDWAAADVPIVEGLAQTFKNIGE